VQEVVDNLHISRVEIREAEAPEIQKYMFKKVRNNQGSPLVYRAPLT
jgi:ATP-dependent DNA helicase MPH1